MAIVHDAMSSGTDTIPYHVEEDNTKNCKIELNGVYLSPLTIVFVPCTHFLFFRVSRILERRVIPR